MAKELTARRCAFNVLHNVTKQNGYAREMFNSYVVNIAMDPSDKAFAQLLVLGCVSTQGVLDFCINYTLRSPKDINDDVRDALRISTYELIFLKKDSYAVVNEGVNLVKEIAPKAGGVANAVLRKVSELVPAFPFGDQNTDLGALANFYGFPRWLTHCILDNMGSQTREFLQACNEQPPMFALVNTFASASREVFSTLKACGAEPVYFTIGNAEGLLIQNQKAIRDKRIQRFLHTQTLIITDASAQTIACEAIQNLPGKKFLEVGSGRGTKTIVLQNAAQRCFGYELDLDCLDVREFKNEILRNRANIANVKVCRTYCGDACSLETVVPYGVSYDGILIDAPCTGIGTLRKHPEIRWRLDQREIRNLSKQGLSMLKSASKHININGIITYSTCTITSQENQDVIKAFLASSEGSNFELIPFQGNSCFAPTLKSSGPDAHFAARLKRIS